MNYDGLSTPLLGANGRRTDVRTVQGNETGDSMTESQYECACGYETHSSYFYNRHRANCDEPKYPENNNK